MTVFIPAGSKLTITADANSAGTVRRLAHSGSAVRYAAAAIAASSTTIVGPFTKGREYELLSDPGLLTYAITETDLDLQNPALDTISENAANAGVTVDGVLLKDGAVTAKQPGTTISANGAITIAPGASKITKAEVAALTLAAPTADQEFTVLHFTSTTANAHTITATGLLNDGVTGGSKDLATFAAFAGATITLIAIALKWHVVSAQNVTVS